MHLTCTVWVQSRDDDWGKIYESCQKREYVSLQDVLFLASIGRRSLCFVYNKPTVKFMHSYNHTEHYRKKLYYLTRTKHEQFGLCICKRNKWVTGQKQKAQRKPLSRSRFQVSADN